MKVKILYLLITSCLIFSCKIGSIGQEQGKSLVSEPVIGSIGIFKEDIISGKFTSAGITEMDEKIRLTSNFQLFKKSTIKKYNRGVLHKEDQIQIIDSLNIHPGYFKFEIADKVGLIKALNSYMNQNLKEYLEITKGNQILIGVDIYFPQEITSLIQNATDVYLVNNKKSSYSLELLNRDRTTRIIHFDEGRSFGYYFMSFCWKENKRRKADIAAFRPVNASCPGSTLKNPNKIYSEDIFDKLN